VQRLRELDELEDEEGRAADAHRVGDGQPVHAEAAVHGEHGRRGDRLWLWSEPDPMIQSLLALVTFAGVWA